jgi:hypothetical protein
MYFGLYLILTFAFMPQQMKTIRAVSFVEELPVNGCVGDLSDEDQENSLTYVPASSAQSSSDGQRGPTYLLNHSPSGNRQWHAFYHNESHSIAQEQLETI